MAKINQDTSTQFLLYTSANEHIKNIYAESELQEESSMKKFGISEFAKKPTNYYNLDVIISVAYKGSS